MFETMSPHFIKDHVAMFQKKYVDLEVVKQVQKDLKHDKKMRAKYDSKKLGNSADNWAKMSLVNLKLYCTDKETFKTQQITTLDA